MSDPTGAEILAVPMQYNDAGAATIGEYLARLLREVWLHGEGFDGKRPFGNSDWQAELALTLAAAGLVEGVIYADGWLDQYDRFQVDDLIVRAIDTLAVS